jgi:two-component system response regulator
LEILIVEDNPHDLELTLRGLRAANLVNNMAIARDGEEALDYLFCRGAHAQRNINRQPRVVLLDLKLPKVDGLEVLQQMRADPATRNGPVVMMTSSEEQSDLVRSYDLGVNSYVVKPVQFDAFVKAVAQLGLYWMLLNHPPVAE